MGWFNDLYQTYENNLDNVGKYEQNGQGKTIVLAPVAHTTQDVDYELIISQDAKFLSIKELDTNDRATIIPSTIDSVSRSGTGAEAYPLHDQLKYIAKDLSDKDSPDKNSPNMEPKFFEDYKIKLSSWLADSKEQSILAIIYKYLLEGHVYKDIEDNLGKIPKKEKAFIRIAVKGLKEPWKDLSLFNSWQNFYQKSLTKVDLDYVEAAVNLIQTKHMKIKGNPKLISGNQTVLAYTGRFTDMNDAVTIGFKASQKAHNALDWLLSKQAKRMDSRYFLVWNNGDNTKIKTPEDYGFDFFPEGEREKLFKKANTGETLALDIGKALEGYRSSLRGSEDVSVLMLDNATAGRMAVVYYQNMDIDTYFKHLQSWQECCYWKQVYFDSEKKSHTYFGAPPLWAIAEAVYGGKGASRNALLKNIRTNLYLCIVEGRQIPENICLAIFNRTCRWTSFESSNEFERQLRVACAVMYERYYSRKGVKSKMTLDVNEKDRSYLFGRLLGVADVIEERAQDFSVPNGTNAERYMTAFSTRPKTTWKTIREALRPYQSKQRKKGYGDGKQQIDEIMNLFSSEEFDDKALDGRFLLGYSAQRMYMKAQNKNEKIEEVN